MSKEEFPLRTLEKYLPRGAYDNISWYLIRHRVHLTITQERTSVLGNFQGKRRGLNHKISVNGNLNKYSFLITLIHEVAHLLAFEKYGIRIAAHGPEWKQEYSRLLMRFISQNIFPDDIEKELISTMEKPSASSCAETSLQRVLWKYDRRKPGFYLLEDIPDRSVFKTSNGTLFRRLNLKRKRILCSQVGTRRQYLFSPVTEVELVKTI